VLARLGHQLGDELLRLLDRLTAEQLRPQVILRRFEGEVHPGFLGGNSCTPAYSVRW
jgi:PleD family two-component response regulator